MNYKLTLAYDGSGYSGWQSQKNAVAVQDVFQEALFHTIGSRPVIMGCSRTDAGVHAIMYVCSFKAENPVPLEKMPLVLNNFLPRDIRVYSAEVVPDKFDARFSARGKTYIYRISNRHKIADPFLYKYVWHFPRELDVSLMHSAAQELVGTHHFDAFAASGGTHKSSVRTVKSLSVTEREQIIEIEITADAYLYNMVRIIAGTLAYVGEGRIPAGELPVILDGRDRTKAGITAPPNGLFLKEVMYN